MKESIDLLNLLNYKNCARFRFTRSQESLTMSEYTRHSRHMAKQILIEQLAKGPLPVAAFDDHLANFGIGRSAFMRARRELLIRSSRVGVKGQKLNGFWVLSLPPEELCRVWPERYYRLLQDSRVPGVDPHIKLPGAYPRIHGKSRDVKRLSSWRATRKKNQEKENALISSPSRTAVFD